jgi:hypothetical protein
VPLRGDTECRDLYDSTPKYTKRITDFKSTIDITIAYLYPFSISAFRLARPVQSTQARLEREVILDQILSAQSCWTGRRKDPEFVSKYHGFLHLGRADLWERAQSN